MNMKNNNRLQMEEILRLSLHEIQFFFEEGRETPVLLSRRNIVIPSQVRSVKKQKRKWIVTLGKKRIESQYFNINENPKIPSGFVCFINFPFKKRSFCSRAIL